MSQLLSGYTILSIHRGSSPSDILSTYDEKYLFLIFSTFITGELREEIQVQSNAILTIERRADRRADLVQQRNLNAEVCVSKIGFIIALVITALLALVAVAIAVSCWLMAYKRRPKTTGPLPHPPEFPNPLFTTPEPLAEPTPDYLH